MVDQHRYIMALSYQLTHCFILHQSCAASCRECTLLGFKIEIQLDVGRFVTRRVPNSMNKNT